TAFMNNVRLKLVNELKAEYPAVHFHAVYGSDTKVRRHDRNIAKSHANDAYVLGTLIPKHRTQECLYTKHRRNNRILSKFYDAKYIDIRDNTTKSGSQLSCGRIALRHAVQNRTSVSTEAGRYGKAGYQSANNIICISPETS
ncbi:MAG: hypothetical protein VZT48_13305, partial [Bulleidia sp.]|nr:hypothetical protein [Bulleidia sp.]